jgi:hypothetical protein
MISRVKPLHGKKRRSVRKRHEADVLRELRRHPGEAPARAARVVREDRGLAEVIDVREGARRRAARTNVGREPTPEVGLLRGARTLLSRVRQRAIRRIAGAVHDTADLVEVAGDLAAPARRLLRERRRRSAD